MRRSIAYTNKNFAFVMTICKQYYTVDTFLECVQHTDEQFKWSILTPQAPRKHIVNPISEDAEKKTTFFVLAMSLFLCLASNSKCTYVLFDNAANIPNSLCKLRIIFSLCGTDPR